MIPPIQKTVLSRAFTIVELLVTVAVIAAIVSMVFYALSNVQLNSRKVECVNNLRLLTLGAINYSYDNANCFPSNEQMPANPHAWYIPLCGGANTELAPLFNRAYVPHGGYLLRKPPFFCPANRAPGAAGGWTNYAMNFYLIGRKSTSLKSAKALFLDAYENTPKEDSWYLSRGNFPSQGAQWYGTKALHGRSINVAFTDGRVLSLIAEPHVIDSATGNLAELESIWFDPNK